MMALQVLEQKQKMGGVNASKENDAMIGKQIRTLENRLDKALIKFNESLAEVGAPNETFRNLPQLQGITPSLGLVIVVTLRRALIGHVS
jgi:hypothetical protein